MKTFPQRSEVDPALCWDLTAIYPDDEAAKVEEKQILAEFKLFLEKYRGQLKSLESSAELIEFLADYEALLKNIYKHLDYYFLGFVVEMKNPERRAAWSRVSMEFNPLFAELSFVETELAEAGEEKLRALAEAAPQYEMFLTEIIEWIPHRLSPETEAALAVLKPTLTSSEELYNTVKFNDMEFPDFRVQDKNYPLSYVLYENNYCYSPNTELRRKSFKEFSKVLASYEEITAAIFNQNLQYNKQISELRKFPSVFDYLLHSQKVTAEMHDRQIDTIMAELKGPMRRYAQLLKQVHGLDELYFSDLKLPLDPEFTSEIEPQEARELCAAALEPMGEDYRELLLKAFPERWLDFAQNDGKSTGGFASHVPNVHPYILLNWDNSMAEVFTLIHELGHAGQFIFSEADQTFLQRGMSLYSVEAPSTFHELLLAYHLLEQDSAEPRFKRWVASLIVGNTYYHNMVTHLHEAAYQREIYRLVDQGETINAEICKRVFKEVLSEFWGDSVILDEGAELTWMRQPHYYSGLYSFTYSAGLTIGTEMFQRLREEGPSALSDWRRFLSSGNSLRPLEQAALAGIDISTDAPLKRTIAYIDELIGTCEKLTAELGC
ncbi:MAG: oligoendopeptidase F [Eubacteriales bacterium]|nr:oligoendopeptidase F [Eubacteriales bacterium]